MGCPSKPDGKVYDGPFFVGRADGAFAGLGNGLCHRKSDSIAAALLGAGAVVAVETVEKLLRFSLGERGAGVFDLQDGKLVRLLESHCNLSAGVGVFYRVIK